MSTAKPKVKLSDDRNAIAIIGVARKAASRAGWSDERWSQFMAQASIGDYAHLLIALQDYFDVH